MDFDTVLEKCGNYGRYQFVLMCMFAVVNLFSSFHYFSQTIISFAPKHSCSKTGLVNVSPHESFSNETCSMTFIINGTELSSDNCLEWEYDYDEIHGYRSVVTELNWVCNDDANLAFGQSLFYVGSVFGTIFFGYLADKIGRLPAMILSNLSGAVGDFATSFTSNLTEFAICRFISGLATDTCFYLMYIMVFEYIRPSKRTFTLNFITGFFYCIGLMATPWLAVAVGDWRYFLRIGSAPIGTIILSAFVLCESAQWLITQKKYGEAINCLKRVAKFNNKEVDESVFLEFEEYYKKKAGKEINKTGDTFFGMFRTPRMRTITIILCIKSMIITLSYDIVSRNMEGLGSSPFVLFSITSIGYIPSALTIMCLQNRFGRKAMAIGSLLLAAIFTTVTGCIIAFRDMDTSTYLLVGMILLARYGAVMAYEAEAQYGAELIPTSVRAQGVANVHVIGYALSFLTSYIIYLGKYFKPLPPIIMSVILVIGALISLSLPETLNRKLPDTLEEGEQFGVGEKWYEFATKGDTEVISEAKEETYNVKDTN